MLHIIYKANARKYDCEEVHARKYDCEEVHARKYDCEEVHARKYDCEEVHAWTTFSSWKINYRWESRCIFHFEDFSQSEIWNLRWLAMSTF